MSQSFDIAWSMLKQDFREAMESQVDPQGQLAQALAMARQQGPAPPIQFANYPRPVQGSFVYPQGMQTFATQGAGALPVPQTMPQDPRQTTLPPEFIGDATVGRDFSQALQDIKPKR